MASPSSWEFYKEEQTKILWVHICTQDLKDVAISINKWWKTRYPDFKIRIVSKKELRDLEGFSIQYRVHTSLASS